ncbi:MAG: electron transport complex subunit RsxA [Proteobacteria bacterium]|nr:electron transport complex subunit RsxA [Pseudomonadota bacterium]
MKEVLLILLSATLVNNFVLTRFLGVCPFMGVSQRLETAVGMAMAVTYVLTLTSAATWMLNAYILVPLSAEHLRLMAFIVLIAVVVQMTEILVRHFMPALHRAMGLFLPLITTNCAVLGVTLLNVGEQLGFMAATVQGFGASLGFGLVLIVFAGLRDRLDGCDVPEAFKGTPIALITAGIMAMAFLGFDGMGR